MNRFPDYRGSLTVWLKLAVLCLLPVIAALPALATAAATGTPTKNPDQKIRITADRLVANTKTGSAEFSGNVRAVQGTTIITSDRLEVRYDQSGQAGTPGESTASIESVISTGNVVIHFDDKIATTEKAVYRSRTGIFTLTGTGTRVTSGENAITGDKITVDRKNDRMTVESGQASRVNAIIFTGPDGLAKPPAGKAKEKSPGDEK